MINQLPVFLNHLLFTERKVKTLPKLQFLSKSSFICWVEPYRQGQPPPQKKKQKNPTYTQLKTTAEQLALGNKEPPSKVKPAWWGVEWKQRYRARRSAPWREEPQLGGPQAFGAQVGQ